MMLRVVFFKQKTAYEMRISDWSSDVCSSDLGSASQFRQLAFRVSRGLLLGIRAGLWSSRIRFWLGLGNRMVGTSLLRWERLVLRRFLLGLLASQSWCRTMREESLLGQLVDSCDLNSPAIRRLIVTGISTPSIVL